MEQYVQLLCCGEDVYYLFISEKDASTCGKCTEHHGRLYTRTELLTGITIPPLHPNCRCHLIVLDRIVAQQYNSNRVGMLSILEQMLDDSPYQDSAILRLTSDGWGNTLSPLSPTAAPVLWHQVDDSVSLQNNIEGQFEQGVERIQQWALNFGSDALDFVDAFIERGEQRFIQADEMMVLNPVYGVLLFADGLALTLPSAMLETIAQDVQDMKDDPSLYNLINLFTLGLADAVKGALAPEEPLSFTHMLDILGVVAAVYGAVKGVQGAVSALDDSVTSMLDDTLNIAPSSPLDDAAGNILDDVLDDVLDDAVAGTVDDIARPLVGDDLLGMTTSQIDDTLEQVAKDYGEIVSSESANIKNASILQENPTYQASYIPDTTTYQITLNQDTKFVRVYGGSSGQMSSWIVRADDIAGLTPAQIKDKLSLPHVPEYICDVMVPAGTTLEVSGANGILGGSGGGVQFAIQGEYGETWFVNSRLLN